LRKMLVENQLYAVVSLPAGIFNPYSGVKTSILLLDRQLAKKTDSVLFVKIENDGFGLGAQRREIEKNDLPDAVNVIQEYVQAVRNGKPESFIAEDLSRAESREKPCGALLVKREKLAENGEYNLTGDRYRTVQTRMHQKWPLVELGAVIDFYRGVTYSKEDESEEIDSKIILRANNIDLNTGKLIFDDLKKVSSQLEFKETQLLKKNDILICTASGSADHIGKVGFAYNDYPYYFGGFMGVVRSKEMIDPYYIYLQLKNEKFRQFLVETSVGANIRNLNYSTFSTFKIPLPPLEVQREIVAEIEGYQKLIDGCRQVVESWKPQIDIDPEWPMVKLGEVCEVKGELVRDINGELIYIGADSIESNTGQLLQSKTAAQQGTNGPVYYFRGKKLLYSKIRPYLNKLCLVEFDGYCSSDMYPLEFQDVDYLFAFYYLLSERFNSDIKGFYERASIPKINREQLFSINIPKPNLAIQQEIISKIESERKVIDGCRELIKTYEDKIKRVIDKVWED